MSNEKLLSNELVIQFLNNVFPFDKKLTFSKDSETLFIENENFMTTAALVSLGSGSFVVHLEIPPRYNVPDSYLNSHNFNYSYYHSLFNVNPILFNINKIKKILFEHNEKTKIDIVKLVVETSFETNAFMAFSKNKTNVSIAGITINLAIKEDIVSNYNEIFIRLLSDKKLKDYKISDIPLARVCSFLNESEISPSEFNQEYIDVIKMYDYN